MNKVCVASIAVLLAASAVPMTTAQLPSEVTDIVCGLGLEDVLGICVDPCELTEDFTGEIDGSFVYDGWSFCAVEGDSFSGFIDNTPGTNNIDLFAYLCREADGTGCFAYNDDGAACTNAPGIWGCPIFNNVAIPGDDKDGVFYVFISAYSSPGSFPGNYSGDATLNGDELLAVLAVDNYSP